MVATGLFEFAEKVTPFDLFVLVRSKSTGRKPGDYFDWPAAAVSIIRSLIDEVSDTPPSGL